MVDLPQPEWPMMQTNSPSATSNQTFSKTVSVPRPRGSGNRRARPSTLISGGGIVASFGVGNETLQERHDLVEHHADNAD